VRIARAIDRFLGSKELERDWTPRSLQSYANVLGRLTDEPPRGFGNEVRLEDFDRADGTDRLRAHIGRNWGKTSGGRRANVISIHHSFFGWALDEGFIDTDPSARIKRPPRRKPDVYRPPVVDQDIAYAATTLLERGAWVLMNDVALRNATVVATRWRQLDLTHGRFSVRVKGGHTLRLPLSPIALERLRKVYQELEPEPDDHVFTVELPRFIGNKAVRYIRDPKTPASPAALRAMVKRVCKRAGVREFGPHALRHGFANRFLRDSGRDTLSLQLLMGHANPATTQMYLDELTIDELEDVLRVVAERRLGLVTSVADGGDTDPDGLEVSRNPLSGPGWSRTTDPDPSAPDPGSGSATEPDEPRITDQEGGHK
jgi:integrase/recombinase XerC